MASSVTALPPGIRIGAGVVIRLETRRLLDAARPERVLQVIDDASVVGGHGSRLVLVRRVRLKADTPGRRVRLKARQPDTAARTSARSPCTWSATGVFSLSTAEHEGYRTGIGRRPDEQADKS